MALLDDLIANAANRDPATFKDAPAAVTTEGDRIRASLAAGTYGNQPQQAKDAAAGTPQITVAPNSGVVNASDNFFSQPSIWQQNQNPAQLRSQLKLDDLVTTAASHKFALEQAQKNAPVQDAYQQARLAHEQAATAAIGATKLRAVQKDAEAMNAVTNFENAMLTAGEPGTPEYDANVRKAIANNPAILTTKYGMQHIPNIAKEHDLAMKAKDLQTKTDAVDFKATYGFPKSALNQSNVAVGNFDPATNQLKQDNNGTHVSVTTPKGDKAIMTIEAYKANGGKLSPETEAARAAPKDMIALANKALADPNASPEHKAAAQKWLNEHTK